jgi:hypothetical protein
MNLLEERENAQTQGFVILVNCSVRCCCLADTHGNVHRPNSFESLLSSPQSSNFVRFDRKLAREGTALLRECLPIRLRVIHLCVPLRHPPFNFVLPVVKFILGKSLRRRLVVHHGSDLEILLSLESHGIIRAIIPTALGGDYHLHAELTEWLVDRLELEGQREVNA